MRITAPTAPSLPVYGIADADALDRLTVPEAVQVMAEAGIEWIQIRAKNAPDNVLYGYVEEAVRRLEALDCAVVDQ